MLNPARLCSRGGESLTLLGTRRKAARALVARTTPFKTPSLVKFFLESQSMVDYALDFWGKVFASVHLDPYLIKQFFHSHPVPFPNVMVPTDEAIERAIKVSANSFTGAGGVPAVLYRKCLATSLPLVKQPIQPMYSASGPAVPRPHSGALGTARQEGQYILMGLRVELLCLLIKRDLWVFIISGLQLFLRRSVRRREGQGGRCVHTSRWITF